MKNQDSNPVHCPKCDEPMEIYTFEKAYDWDGIPHAFDYTGYRCIDCYDYLIDQHGNRVISPIPQGYLFKGKRSACPTCGLLLKKSPCQDYFDVRRGEFIHVPWFGKHCYLCDGKTTPHQETKNQVFRKRISIPPKVLEKWNLDLCNFLDSQCKDGYVSTRTFKLAYSPSIKELIVFGEKEVTKEDKQINEGPDSQQTKRQITYTERQITYAEALSIYGSGEPEDYILGRVFRNRGKGSNKILLKKHENKHWMMETHFTLRRMGVTLETPLIWRDKEL